VNKTKKRHWRRRESVTSGCPSFQSKEPYHGKEGKEESESEEEEVVFRFGVILAVTPIALVLLS
jgi:hypothetical protein